MTAPIVLVFCAEEDRERVRPLVREYGDMLGGDGIEKDTDVRLGLIRMALEQGRALILLGVGPTGCASLAAYVAERGLDGVVGVVLVDPAAPPTEPLRTDPPVLERLVHALELSSVYGGRRVANVDLGALEPLRAVAERARFVCRRHSADGTSIDVDSSGAPIKGPCPWCRAHTPARLVLAVCPEAPPCEACGGQTLRFDGKAYPCHACSGTGRMLSSAEVAGELLGPCRSDGYGGLVTIPYASRSALSEHGIAEALRVALDGAS